MHKNGLIILTVLILILVLTSCSIDGDDCGLHSNTTINVDQNGVTLLPSEDAYASFEQISQYYVETEACLGLTAEGPDVVYRNFRTYYNQPDDFAFGPWGVYYASGLIQVNTDENPGHGFTRDCRTDKETLKHEFIHHILNFNNLDHSHDNPLFQRCGAGVNTYN